MKTIFLTMLLSFSAQAMWTNFPDPKGQAKTKEICERTFGGTCFELPNGVSQDLVKLEDGVLRLDEKLVEEGRARKEQAKIEQAARKQEIADLKAVLKDKDPSKEELRKALQILLEKMGD